MAEPFSVATYNVLAPAYARPERYPGTDAAELAPERRLPRLIERILGLDADVVGLQEVDAALCRALAERLDPVRHNLSFARKAGRAPDGSATIVRAGAFEVLGSETLHYSDGRGGPDSGHLALVTLLAHAGRRIALANTHLKWDPPTVAGEAQWAGRQIRELIALRERLAPGADAWIVLGDFNVGPGSAVLEALAAAGFRDALEAAPATPTCVTNGRAHRADYLFVSSGLAARSEALPPLDEGSVLPSAREPSDHLPIRAEVRWRTP